MPWLRERRRRHEVCRFKPPYLEPNALLLLGPRTRQRFGEAGDREIRRRGACRRGSLGIFAEFRLTLGVERAHPFPRFLGLVVKLERLHAERADAGDRIAVRIE